MPELYLNLTVGIIDLIIRKLNSECRNSSQTDAVPSRDNDDDVKTIPIRSLIGQSLLFEQPTTVGYVTQTGFEDDRTGFAYVVIRLSQRFLRLVIQ